MTEDHRKIDQLQERLQVLSLRQEQFRKEIESIKQELDQLKAKVAHPTTSSPPPITYQPESAPPPVAKIKTEFWEEPQKQLGEEPLRPKKQEGGLEKYIGENLFSKLGIAIIVIGVGIGAKFAIDNDLISPMMRVALGYLIGFGLLGFAVKLKEAYHRYSAVLMSGAMAIFYFMTYLSHSIYGFIPDVLAFGLMVAITGMTVVAAIYYKEQVIALIGQVGAYAVPFLLSDGSDEIQTLFTYVAIINIGVLFVAFKQYWKSLYFSAFLLTWVFFSGWCLLGYEPDTEFNLAFSFNIIYFLIFYVTFLAYKMVRQEKYLISDVFLLLINSFVFFGIGYFLWEGHFSNGKYLGVFALLNGLLHLMVGILIYLNEKVDRNILLLIGGLVVLFFTLAVPIQLDGNWVTLIWMGEAVLLFTLGRIRKAHLYEKLSYPLLFLAFLSLLEDWNSSYLNTYLNEKETFFPIFNIGFYTTLLCAVGYGAVQWVNSQEKYPFPYSRNSIWALASQFVLPGMLLIVAYNVFGMEISQYWQYKIRHLDSSGGLLGQIRDFESFAVVWQLIYSLSFFSLLSLFNCYWLKNKILAYVNLVLNALVILVFLSNGIIILSGLWEAYYETTTPYPKGVVYLLIRYLALLVLGILVFSSYKYIYSSFLQNKLRTTFDISFHLILLWVLSSEWLNWGTTFEMGASYKLGLSILWGTYSLLLIILGIWKNKVHLRLAAIILFGITLIKLFFYDIAHLATLPKTVIFIALGSLLLLISFLYNKYRQVLFEEEV